MSTSIVGSATLESSITERRSAKPRICIQSARRFNKKAFQCGSYEAQDVLCQVDDVDMICLEPGHGFRSKELLQRRLLYRDVSKRLIFMNPGLRKVRLAQEYDLFVVLCPTYWDLLYVNAIEGWKDHCKTSVCWIDELWVKALPSYKYWLHALRQFDHVFLSFRGTVAPLSKAIGRDCNWLPPAVDSVRFTPYPNPPARVVDVYSIGRRWEGTHHALLQAAERRELFYVYDTFSGAYLEPFNHREHRELYSNMAKRSRYFVVAPAKMDAPEETDRQVEIGYRYFEGAASGAVMIGQSPDCDAFRELFSWPDVVMYLQPDGSDVMDVLARLNADPDRRSEISRRNTAQSLLHHDWVYRWKEIFRVAGMEPSPAMAARERRLKDLAELAISGA